MSEEDDALPGAAGGVVDELLILGFISNRVKTWDELIDFWSNDAGPFK